jgi:hypothetical protein
MAVETVHVDHEELSIAERFAHIAVGGALVHLAFDPGNFAASKEIISLAHQYGMIVVASNLYAVSYGADIAIGFSEDKVFRYVAHHMMMLLHGVRTQTTGFHFPLQVHCNSKNLALRPYILDNVGAMFLDGNTRIHVHSKRQSL